jgi:hypothetical protein
MAKELLTVRQIAELIQRPREQLITVIDRIRAWSDLGLLKVVGSKTPGTGNKRLYEPPAIIDAAVMTALTDAGLAAVRVGKIAAADGRTVLGFGRLGACEILDPSKSERAVFLVMSGPKVSPWSVHLAYEEMRLGALTPNEPYSIIWRLNDYFRPLRGIVSVVDERGTPKIDLIAKER